MGLAHYRDIWIRRPQYDSRIPRQSRQSASRGVAGRVRAAVAAGGGGCVCLSASRAGSRYGDRSPIVEPAGQAGRQLRGDAGRSAQPVVQAPLRARSCHASHRANDFRATKRADCGSTDVGVSRRRGAAIGSSPGKLRSLASTAARSQAVVLLTPDLIFSVVL